MSLIPDILLTRRKQLKLTQQEVAGRAKMAQCAYARLEGGHIANPGAGVIVRLAAALKIRADKLLG